MRKNQLTRTEAHQLLMQQPIKVIEKNGTEKVYKSVAECARKTGVTESTIFATINGRRRLKKVKYPLFEKVNH